MAKHKEKDVKNKITKKDVRKIRSEIISEKNKIIKPLEEKSAALENSISEYEEEVNKLNDLLIEASSNNNGELIGEYGKRLAELNKLIDDAFEELDNVVQELDSRKKEYDNRLSQIEE